MSNSTASASPIIPEFEKDTHYQVFNQLLKSKQFGKTIEIAGAKLKKDKQDFRLLLVLAYAEAGLKNWDAAIKYIKQALEYIPPGKQTDILVDLGNIYLLQGNNAKAKESYLHSLELKSDSDRALYSLGLFFYSTGKNKEALKKYQEALQQSPKHLKSLLGIIQLYKDAGNYEKIIPLSRRLQSIPSLEEEGYYLEASALARKAKPDYQGSIALLKKILKKKPENKKYIGLLGHVLLKSGQYSKETSTLLEKAVSLNPKFYEGHKLLAAVAMKQNDLLLMVKHLKKALAIKETSKLYHLLGRVNLQLGFLSDGLSALSKALEHSSIKDEKGNEWEEISGLFGDDPEESEQKLREALMKDPGQYEVRILLIFNLIAQGGYEEAVKLTKKGLTYYPQGDKLLLNFLAKSYIEKGLKEDAEKSLLEALKLDPDFVLTHLLLSTIYFGKGEYNKTERELHFILEQNPEHLQTNIQLARVYQATSKNEKAEKLLESLLKENPLDPDLFKELIFLEIKTSNFGEALSNSDKLIWILSDSVLGYIIKSDVYKLMGNMHEALDIIDTGLEEFPESRAALEAGAKLAFGNGQYEKSIQYLERYQSNHGLQKSNLIYLYTTNLIETGKYNEARHFAIKRLSKENLQTSYLIGLSWVKEGNLKKAEEYLEQATQKESKLDKAFFDLARVKLSMGKQKIAKNLLNTAIKINGRKVKYYLALAAIYQKDGEIDLSISTYQKGLENKANPIPLLNNLAFSYLAKKDSPKAIYFANQALEKAPGDPNVLDTVGWVYFQAKEYKKAIPYLEKASEKLPASALFHYHVGLTYYKLGELNKAKKELETVLLKNKKAPWAAEAMDLLSSISNQSGVIQNSL
ncbi:MAG: tetratricopeptide repeat protein [Candidatus Anammoxibacter sp.]